MNPDHLDRQIDEIERELLRDDPALDKRFARLDNVNRRHEATVFTLLVSSAVLLVIGLATTSMIAWLVGVVSLVASFSVDTRHERELREVRRSREQRHRPAAIATRRDREVDGTLPPLRRLRPLRSPGSRRARSRTDTSEGHGGTPPIATGGRDIAHL